MTRHRSTRGDVGLEGCRIMITVSYKGLAIVPIAPKCGSEQISGRHRVSHQVEGAAGSSLCAKGQNCARTTSPRSDSSSIIEVDPCLPSSSSTPLRRILQALRRSIATLVTRHSRVIKKGGKSFPRREGNLTTLRQLRSQSTWRCARATQLDALSECTRLESQSWHAPAASPAQPPASHAALDHE